MILRPLLGAGVLVLVMVTLALSISNSGDRCYDVGSGSRYLNLGFKQTLFRLTGHVVLTNVGVLSIVIAVVVVGLIMAALRSEAIWSRHSGLGQDGVLSSYRGVNVAMVTACTWGIAMATADLAGALYSVNTGLDISTSGNLGLACFPAILVGGLTAPGALVGSLILAENKDLN